MVAVFSTSSPITFQMVEIRSLAEDSEALYERMALRTAISAFSGFAEYDLTSLRKRA
jgi:hypothetical protein